MMNYVFILCLSHTCEKNSNTYWCSYDAFSFGCFIMLFQWKYLFLPQRKKSSGLWLCAYVCFICFVCLSSEKERFQTFLKDILFFSNASSNIKSSGFPFFWRKDTLFYTAVTLCFRRPVVCWQKTLGPILWNPKDFQGCSAWPGTIWMPSC